MLPADYAIFEQTISKPRLNSYRSYFNADLGEAIGLYMWNAEVSSCMAVLLSYFEIVLRNNIHRVLSQHHHSAPSAAWYTTIESAFSSETKRRFRKVTHNQDHTPRIPAPSPDSVVSNVMFGVWHPVLKSIQGSRETLFPQIFPNHPLNANPQDWRTKAKRHAALRYIDELSAARNRIGHHEPLWKFAAVKDTSTTPATLIAAASTNQAESIARFHRLLNLLDEGLRSINQDLAADLSNSSWRVKLNFLLTDRGLTRFRKTRHIPRPLQVTPATFRKDFGLVCRANQPVVIASGQGRGTYYP